LSKESCVLSEGLHTTCENSPVALYNRGQCTQITHHHERVGRRLNVYLYIHRHTDTHMHTHTHTYIIILEGWKATQRATVYSRTNKHTDTDTDTDTDHTPSLEGWKATQCAPVLSFFLSLSLPHVHTHVVTYHLGERTRPIHMKRNLYI